MQSNNGEKRRKRVAVMRFGALGDVAAAIPVVYSACRCHPGTDFVMLTSDKLTGLFINRPDNLAVEGIPTPDMHHPPTGQWHLAAEIYRRHNPEACIDLHGTRATRMLRLYMKLHGVHTYMPDSAASSRRALTRSTNKVMLPLPSVRARYREAFHKAGLPVENLFNGIYGLSGRGDTSLIAAHTGGPKPQGTKWIGIAPFAAYPCKEYPLEMMEEVIRALLASCKCTIFIFGGKGREAEKARAWAEAFPGVTAVAGKQEGFDAELSLLSHLDLMLSMDSANMHLAALTRTPTVSIWGATHYYCGFTGWGQDDNSMVQIPLSCRPCSISGDKECHRHDMLCLTAIRPETVTRKIQETLTPS